MTTQVAILNATTTLTDAQIAPAVAALQTQITRDFAPVWHIDAHLTFVPRGHAPMAGSWVLSLLDNSDQAGALGYHDITAAGLPLGKAFAATDAQYGLSWSVTVSHELCEMLADPWINLTVFNQNTNTAGRMYAYEVCDACEDDSFGYEINGTKVSDFVYPSWFEGWRTPHSTKFDFGGHITQPFMLLSGGYISYFDVSNGGGWQQITADKAPTNMRHRAAVGSRRERRTILKENWVASTAV
jgi:hypothetical protein